MKEAILTIVIKETPSGLTGSCQVKGEDKQAFSWQLAESIANHVPQLITVVMNEINQQEQSNASKH